MVPEQRKLIKVYIVTSPFGSEKSGDSDYVEGVINLFKSSEDLQVEHLLCQDEKEKKCEQKLKTHLRYLTKQRVFNEDLLLEEGQKQIVVSFIEKIEKDRKGNNSIFPVLNLQIRPQETGMTIFPQHLQLFKQKGIAIIVTCHEYALNTELKKEILNQVSQEYFEQADHIIFFNEQDKKLAIKEGKHFSIEWKSSLSKVVTPLTLVPPIQKDEFNVWLNREPSIIFFGTIREGKGFEKIHHVVQILIDNKKELPKTKIIVVGVPSSINILKEMLLELCKIAKKNTKDEVNYEEKICEMNLKDVDVPYLYKNLPILEKLPIEFHFSEPLQKVSDLFERCKYACAYDEIKGFANNATAMTSLLAHGCILFANKGSCSPEEDTGIVCPSKENFPKTIIDELIAREKNFEINRLTLYKQQEFFAKNFIFKVVQSELKKVFSTVVERVEKNNNSLLVTEEGEFVRPLLSDKPFSEKSTTSKEDNQLRSKRGKRSKEGRKSRSRSNKKKEITFFSSKNKVADFDKETISFGSVNKKHFLVKKAKEPKEPNSNISSGNKFNFKFKPQKYEDKKMEKEEDKSNKTFIH